MTDQLSPAEAAAANAIDAQLAANANADLAGEVPVGTTPEENVAELEAKLAAIKAHNAKIHESQNIPHAIPTVHAPAPEPVVYAAQPEPVKAVAVSASAQIQAKIADGWVPPKRQYAYKRNRK